MVSQVSATTHVYLHCLINACLILIECDLLSAKELQAQYRSNDQIQVEAHTARRVKENLNNQSDEKYEARYEYIQDYLDELTRLNPGTHTSHQRVEDTNEFLR